MTPPAHRQQGSTLMWTEGYGGQASPGRRRERLHDLFFVVTLSLLFFSVVALR